MKAWRFTTEPLPVSDRPAAWRHALGQLFLPIAQLAETPDFQGQVSCLVSPMGMEFARVTSGPQEIAGHYPNQPNAIWLALLLEGRSILTVEGQQRAVTAGDIIYGPTGAKATLSFETPFRQLFVKVPRVALNPRLIAPWSLKAGLLSGGSGIGHVFAGMLRAMADSFEELTGDQIRPVELALTEFLITSLAGDRETSSLSRGAGARAAHLHRICQTIETRLGEPDLTLHAVAEERGISPRYLQKLFTSVDQSFNTYLRVRRLERCRADLVSPLHGALTISEICFRWGFNGSAHFSRAFRDQFGLSPREYRQSSGKPTP
jgi:AraC-like DNA-binding protein